MEKALSLPEIRKHIARFLSPKDLKTCMTVSRAWAESTAPCLWWSLTERRKLHYLPIVVAQKYARFVQILNLAITENHREIYNLFDHLKTIRMAHDLYKLGHVECAIDLIQRNRSSIRAVIEEYGDNIPLNMLKVILECPQLEQLEVGRVILNEQDLVKSLLQSCTRLTQLKLHSVHIPDHLMLLSQDLVFHHLEWLHLSNIDDRVQIELLKRSPNLRKLVMTEEPSVPVKEFIEVVLPRCPKLCALVYHCYFNQVTDEDSLVNALPPMKCLLIGRNFLKKLCQPSAPFPQYFATLQAIDLRYYRINHGPIVQTVLSGCPNLRFISGGWIRPREMEGASPWICRNLQYFNVQIFDFDDTIQSQDGILERLAHLVQLRILKTVLHPTESVIQRSKLQPIRPEDMLKPLKTLKRLEHITLRGLAMDWLPTDVQWAIQTWPDLHSMQTSFHQNEYINQSMRNLLELKGINYSNPIKNIMEYVEVDTN